MRSLFSRLASRGNEDFSTELLSYLFQNDQDLSKKALLFFGVPEVDINTSNKIEWRTQVHQIYEGGSEENPGSMYYDLQCIGETFHIVVENKLWAGFTPNQPLHYMDELGSSNKEHKTLVILAPECRREELLLKSLEKIRPKKKYDPNDMEDTVILHGQILPQVSDFYCSEIHFSGFEAGLKYCSWESLVDALQEPRAEMVEGFDILVNHLKEFMDEIIGDQTVFDENSFDVKQASLFDRLYSTVDYLRDEMCRNGAYNLNHQSGKRYYGFNLQDSTNSYWIGLSIKRWKSHFKELDGKKDATPFWLQVLHPSDDLEGWITDKGWRYFPDQSEDLISIPLYVDPGMSPMNTAKLLKEDCLETIKTISELNAAG